MARGRPKQVDAGALYAFAHQFYWDFKRLAEGSYRWRLDEAEYRQLLDDIDRKRVTLSKDQRAALEAGVDREIREGRIDKSQRELRLREQEEGNLMVTRHWLQGLAAENATEKIKVPGEPETVEELLTSTNVEDVRAICGEAKMLVESRAHPGQTVEVSAWPISSGSMLPTYLFQHAREFIAAKADPRFPRSHRPTTKAKQLWFLSRALAGAVYGVKTRTAINLVGAKNPEEIFGESRAGKAQRAPGRRRAKKRRYEDMKI